MTNDPRRPGLEPRGVVAVIVSVVIAMAVIIALGAGGAFLLKNNKRSGVIGLSPAIGFHIT